MSIHRFAAVAVGVCFACASTYAADFGARVKSAAGPPSVVLPFQEIVVTASGGSQTLELSGLPALPQASFFTTAVVPARIDELTLTLDPVPGAPYESGAGKALLFSIENTMGVDVVGFNQVLIVEITASNALQTDLYAGIDTNGDGQAQSSEQLCHVSATPNSNTTARCVVDVRNASAANAWALIDIPQGSPSVNYSVAVSGAVAPFVHAIGHTQSQAIAGPGHAAAGATFPLRLWWDTGAFFAANERNYGAVLIDDSPVRDLQHLGKQGVLPFALTFIPAAHDVTNALGLGTAILAAGASQLHQFIDVPANGTLTIDTSYPSAQVTDTVDFYAVRADFPASSAIAQVPPAPAAASDSPRWQLDAQHPFFVVTLPVTAGRWYIVAHNGSNHEVPVNFSASPHLSGPVPTALPGAYYNPQRAGSGVFLSQSGGQQALYWYTYLEDGTPVWYVAQGAVPTAGAPVWTANLYRLTWDGAETNVQMPTSVGSVAVTPIGTTDFMISWQLYGVGGSEHFTLLGPSRCEPFAGGNANLTGQWFAPAQAGYGMDVLALADQQSDTFYFYDALGQPRWVAGSVAGISAASTLSMHQFSGFCPTCAYTPATHVPIGTLAVTYTNATQGRYASNLTLATPLSGTWNIDQPIARLTGNPSCGL